MFPLYSVSLRIQSECGKMRTRITPNTDTFYAVTTFSISKTKRYNKKYHPKSVTNESKITRRNIIVSALSKYWSLYKTNLFIPTSTSFLASFSRFTVLDELISGISFTFVPSNGCFTKGALKLKNWIRIRNCIQALDFQNEFGLLSITKLHITRLSGTFTEL